MEQMEELQRRIEGALNRIGSGVGNLQNAHADALSAAEAGRRAAEEALAEVSQAPDVDPAELAELRELLDDEKTANAQLNARNDQLHDRVSEMERKVAAVDKVDQIVAMEAELELLRNEANKPPEPSPEVGALRQELARLKSDQEVALNQAAADRDIQQDRIDALEAKLREAEVAIADAASAGEEAPNEEGGSEILLNEISVLQEKLASATAAAEAAQARPQADADPQYSEALEAKLSVLDRDLQALRAANEQLLAANAALRAANAEGGGQPELINQALEAEIEGLRAARAADKAEVDVVIARLAPLLQPEDMPGDVTANVGAPEAPLTEDQQAAGETA